MKRKLVLLLWLAVSALIAAEPFAVTRQGKATAKIYLDAGASASEKLAARELQSAVQKISGAQLEIVTQITENCIIPATQSSAFLPADLREKLQGAKHAESFVISNTDGKHLYLAGKTPVGALYAAYTLLEEQFHMAWLFPGEAFEYVEKNPTLSVPEISKLYEPAFDYRLLHAMPFAKTRDAFIWAARNKIQMPGPYAVVSSYGPANKDFFEPRLRDGIVSDGSHITFYLAAPPQQYLKTHPEYFALVDGKRSQNTTHADTHHCISNPELQQLVADYIVNLHQKYGDKVSFTFGAPDAARGWCECENCRALDAGTADHSRRFHMVVRKIAAMVYERCPDMQFNLWAYWTYRNIPDGLTVDPRMKIYFCSHGRSHAHHLDDPGCTPNVHMFKQMKDWLALNPKMYIYEYTNANFAGYAPVYEPLAYDLRLYREMGLLGIKNEYHLPDGKYGPKQDPWRGGPLYARTMWDYFYLFGKLTWNPDLDPVTVLNDAYQKYYGPAASAMQRYHAERRRIWDSTEGSFGWPIGDNRTPKLLQNPAAQKKLLSLLDEAEKAAASDPVALERVRFDRSCLEKLWIAKADEYRKAASRTFFAPQVKTAPQIDGETSESVWNQASFVSDFLHWETQKPLPPELATSAAVCCDDQALYIAVTAQEPAMDKLRAETTEKGDPRIFKDDSIEIFLAPTNEGLRYYQFCINTNGAVFDAEQPGGRANWDSGITAVCRKQADRFVIEARIPFAKMEGKFRVTDCCPILIARNRRVDDALGKGGFSLGGSPYHYLTGFRMMVFGKPYIQNGTFTEPDPKDPAKLKGWNLKKNGKILREGNKVSVELGKGGILEQHLWDWKGPLGQSEKPRHISVIFTASGEGRAVLYMARYTDQYVSNKLQRKYHGSEMIQAFKVTDKPQDFRVDYTIPPDQWASLGINAPDGTIRIERVTVLLNQSENEGK